MKAETKVSTNGDQEPTATSEEKECNPPTYNAIVLRAPSTSLTMSLLDSHRRDKLRDILNRSHIYNMF